MSSRKLPKLRSSLTLALALLLAVPVAAQEYAAPGGGAAGVPSAPLATGASFQESQGGIIGGRAGRPRIEPGSPGRRHRPGAESLPLPRGHRPAKGEALPMPFAFDVPVEPPSDGPPDGLTLDQAIDLLTRGSLSLRSKNLEIPQARADELTASLRKNPFVYADGQLLPYRHFNAATNPGGPSQYDLNVTQPFDVSGKRTARIEVAMQARRVVEAQYQDAVRLEMDNLYTIYVDALAARETMRFAEAGMVAVEHAMATQAQKNDQSEDAQLQADHVEVHRDNIELAMLDATANLQSAKRTLATVLSLPRDAVERLDLRGSLRDDARLVQTPDELIQMAVAVRPDLAAFRLNVCRALADVRLAKANRFSDVFVIYQPFTYQDQSPYGLPSSYSWVLGGTVTAPIYDRNQGNIRRANVNVEQSRLEMQSVERRIVTEVDDALAEYQISRNMVERIEKHLLPAARHVRDRSLKASEAAGDDVYAYLIAQRDYQDIVRQYRDVLVRHRRAMLRLNTVVGVRILP